MEPTSTSERATGEVVAQGKNFMMKDEKDHNILSIRISLLQSQLRNEKHSNSVLKRENSKLTVDIAHHLTVTARAERKASTDAETISKLRYDLESERRRAELQNNFLEHCQSQLTAEQSESLSLLKDLIEEGKCCDELEVQVVELKREVCDAAKNATVLETRIQNVESEAAAASRSAEDEISALREERDAARSELRDLKMDLSRARGLENQVQLSVNPDDSLDLEMCT
ncbi:hypothetical protein V495_08336 [Pseudogymnoascus sp. VKM F-4514 (FW-929)]|nr:hypothetical protein V495_08336 [Pseudogymnoascus sp. VKM F-4514 (FW-929)]KFY57015.1 hypothetical protein V497_05810 [Pseudogymnoascus sp. VKM F-4516 (FW-969)]